MQEKTRVVVTRAKRADQPRQELPFGIDDIPAGEGIVAEYRAHAWQAYTRQPIPDVTQEAWRRTDLRALPAASFRLADGAGAVAVPQDLLQPLVQICAGQIILGSGRPSLSLDLSFRQGVISGSTNGASSTPRRAPKDPWPDGQFGRR
jgi:hypothetical protein